MLIQTTEGLIERDLLAVRDIATEEENARVIATEWFLDGKLVRRDVNVNMLRGLDLNSEQESM